LLEEIFRASGKYDQGENIGIGVAHLLEVARRGSPIGVKGRLVGVGLKIVASGRSTSDELAKGMKSRSNANSLPAGVLPQKNYETRG